MGVWWAKRATDGSSVWPSEFANDAGVPNMAAARRACRRHELVCPDCGGDITATSESTRTLVSAVTGLPTTSTTRAHFKHLAGAAADADCPGAARMSDQHLAAQENIARVLQRRHPDATVRLEAVHAGALGHAGRSDILLEPREGAPLCVEVQASWLTVADLQDRTDHRAAQGYVVEWIFIVDRQTLTERFEPPAMIKIVLKSRGYVYLLEDPMADEPKLCVAVAPEISSQIPDLSNRRLPDGHVHVLRARRRVSDFTLVGMVPGAAGLRCEGLHGHLERWMNESRDALNRIPPRAVARLAPAVESWRAEHERLEHELFHAEHACSAAQTALHQANADATATAAAAAAVIAAQPPHRPPQQRVRRRDRLWRWLRPRSQPDDAFWSMPMARDDSAKQFADAARARVRTLRDELAKRDVEHQAAKERLAGHTAERAAAEQLDDARHAEALKAARDELDQRLGKPRNRIARWLLMLPGSADEPKRQTNTRGGAVGAGVASQSPVGDIHLSSR